MRLRRDPKQTAYTCERRRRGDIHWDPFGHVGAYYPTTDDAVGWPDVTEVELRQIIQGQAREVDANWCRADKALTLSFAGLCECDDNLEFWQFVNGEGEVGDAD